MKKGDMTVPFPQSFMDELTARNDIVDVVGSYVQLTRKGGNLSLPQRKNRLLFRLAGQTDFLLLRL